MLMLCGAALLPAQEPELSVRPAVAFAPARIQVELRLAPHESFALFVAAGPQVVLAATGRGRARIPFAAPADLPGVELRWQAIVAGSGRLRLTPVAANTVASLALVRRSPPRGTQAEQVVNVGQRCALGAELLPATLRSAAQFRWQVSGDHVRDYVETTDRPFALLPMQPSDYTAPELTCYFLPAAAQIHPRNGPPVARSVRLRVELPGGVRAARTRTFLVERNDRDPELQAEDFYVETNHPQPSGHGMPPTTILNEHARWHVEHDWYLFPPCGPGLPGFREFLAFHRRMQQRFAEWRAVFGFAPITPWNPAHPIPRGPEIDHARRENQDPQYPLPGYLTLVGGPQGSPCFGRGRLADFRSDVELSAETFEPWHNGVHARVGLDMAHHHTSPKDPVFWRFHEFLDREVYERWLRTR